MKTAPEKQLTTSTIRTAYRLPHGIMETIIPSWLRDRSLIAIYTVTRGFLMEFVFLATAFLRRGKLALTHLRRSWRDLRLSMSELWTRVHIMPGQVDLAVDAVRSSSGQARDVCIFTQDSSDFSAAELDQVKGLLAQSGSHMRSCKILVDGGLPPWEQDPLSLIASSGLPPFELLCNRPHLFFPTLLPHLTQLEFQADSALLLDGVLKLLRACPSLEFLTLKKRNMLSHRMDAAACDFNAVLPELRRLEVIDCGTVFTHCLLKRLSFPSSTAVHVSFNQRGLPVFDTADSALLPVMSLVQGAVLRFTRTRRAGADSEVLVHLRSSTDSFSAQWRWSASENETTDLELVGQDVFDLPALRKFRIELENVDVAPALWTQVLGQVPKENDLRLKYQLHPDGPWRWIHVEGVNVGQRLPVNFPRETLWD